MKFSFSEKFKTDMPNVREGILIVHGLKNDFNSDHSFQFLCAVMDRIRKDREKKSVVNATKLEEWKEAFRKASFNPEVDKPSHIALLERVLEKKDLPNINPVVNIINAVQLKNLVPIGAHDLDKIEGDVVIGANENNMKFPPRNSEDQEDVAVEEIIHSDSKDVLTRKWCWRQGRKDLCNEGTKSVVLFINSVNPDDDLRMIAEELIAAIKKFTNSQELKTTFDILTSDKSELDTESLPEISTQKTINLVTHEIKRDRKIIDRILNKAVEEIFPSKEEFEKLLLSGRRLKLFQGFDPTAPTLHIGHTVMMRKLEDFRKLGHEVIMLIGDFTARIGDPTDKSSARVVLSAEQVNENLKSYKEQAARFIDIDNSENPVTVVFNNDWLGKMSFQDVTELASHFTVQQMMKRDMFQKRIEEDKPIHLHEFLYPLMQGYDSVALGVDLELGGNDQFFNMLAGRHLVGEMLNKEKFVIAGKLLVTAEGKKMGKSEGNMIALADEARDIYGKVMAFTDNQLVSAFELLTNASLEKVGEVEKKMQDGENPINLKKELARTITAEIKGEDGAREAEEFFEKVFQERTFDVELPEVVVESKEVDVIELLTTITGFASSKSEARRLIAQGAVRIEDEKLEEDDESIELEEDVVLKVGKKVVKVVLKK